MPLAASSRYFDCFDCGLVRPPARLSTCPWGKPSLSLGFGNTASHQISMSPKLGGAISPCVFITRTTCCDQFDLFIMSTLCHPATVTHTITAKLRTGKGQQQGASPHASENCERKRLTALCNERLRRTPIGSLRRQCVETKR